MGDEVSTREFSHQERQRYREKVQLCLDVLARMLAGSSFETAHPRTGLEIELNLVGADLQPMMANKRVLHDIADPGFQTEIGAYTIELNVPPRPLSGTLSFQSEADLRASLNRAQAKAAEAGATIVMIGILPTVMPEHLEGAWMSPSARYAALNESIASARGEDLFIDIVGRERLALYSSSIAPESACTSVQLHLQVAPSDFAPTWNAAQLLAGAQLALGANSPYFFGRELWAETRTELFSQAIDTRPQELKNQGVRPRAFFGDRWITSIFDLFEENVRYFPALLPEVSDEDPVAVLEAGVAPRLQELRLHNGTIYRWNRPIYDTVGGRAHLRVENRVLPAGPTVADVMANAAFYYGALRMLSEQDRPLWTRTPFATARENFTACARDGFDARVYWPGLGEVAPGELVLRQLLPMAHAGLERWGVPAPVRDRYLGIIEARARTGRNGASWQVQTVSALERRGADRATALRQMLGLYCEGMGANAPVHTWEVPAAR